ncbi:MAG: radical SAM protein [Pseudomonadota bacterium]
MADGQADNCVRNSADSFGKFQHPDITADGARRASVSLTHLDTLWVNTGTLCNVECAHCYIESSPTNDRLAYLTCDELAPFLEEAKSMGAREIGFTGGEPFMNPDMIAMIEAALKHGFSVLILTNAMRPMMRPKIQEQLLALHERFGEALALRVSLDHYSADRHDEERGPGTFAVGMEGLIWLASNGLALSVAGRTLWTENETEMRDGFAALFAAHDIALDAHTQDDLILFPEMDEAAPVPEITTACWSLLDKSPADMMCASSRMLVKRKGADAPAVLSCTLLPYDPQFEMGKTLKEASGPVKLNHPHCAKFCVLGGASCSG